MCLSTFTLFSYLCRDQAREEELPAGSLSVSQQLADSSRLLISTFQKQLHPHGVGLYLKA